MTRMIKQSSLDEELREKIERIQIACWTDEGRHTPEAVSCEQCSNELVELVKSELTDIEQLILTEVIGEDLPYFDESSHTKTWRNGMRSPTLRSLINHTKEEQRQSLSNLMRGGGES